MNEVEVSFVVPVYNDAENVLNYVENFSSLILPHLSTYEVIFCIDPSSDGTEELAKELNNKNSNLKYLILTRRFGQGAATMAGLKHSRGKCVIVMDVDMQDPIEIIPQMMEKWRSGDQLVLPQRRTRTGEPALKKLTAKLGYTFLKRYAFVTIPPNTGDFRLMGREIVDEIIKFREHTFFLRGISAYVGHSPTILEFDRKPRLIGSTKYNKWTGSIKGGFDGIIGFSTVLLKIGLIISVVLAILSLILAVVYFIFKLNGFDFPLGNPTIVILILISTALNLGVLSLLGLYIGRIYDEVLDRPHFIIKEIEKTLQKI